MCCKFNLTLGRKLSRCLQTITGHSDGKSEISKWCFKVIELYVELAPNITSSNYIASLFFAALVTYFMDLQSRTQREFWLFQTMREANVI